MSECVCVYVIECVCARAHLCVCVRACVHEYNYVRERACVHVSHIEG